MPRKRKLKHVLRREWCKGCLICVDFCPKQVLALDDDAKILVVRPDDCIECRMCELRCPDFAIELVPLSPEELAAQDAGPGPAGPEVSP